MIWDSSPWKDDLLKRANTLERFKDSNGLTDDELVVVEQTIMVAFYTIRKLIEARTKLSTSTSHKTVSLIAYPPTDKITTLLNWHRTDKLFDMNTSSTITKDILFLCNQFVHSYIFTPCLSETGGLECIFVTSDRERRNFLYEVEINTIIDLLRMVGNDYPSSQKMILNPNTGDYDVQSV